MTRIICFLLFGLSAFRAFGQAGSPSTAQPTLPVVDYNACPFEGCTFGKWRVTRESPVYSSWKDDRMEIGTVEVGESVLGMTGVHITRQPDRIAVKADIPALGVHPGDLILRYMYRGEGFADIWANGRWYKESDCSFVTEKDGGGCQNGCSAEVTEYGKKDWWVQIKMPNGKTGWVLVEDNFDGMDSLAGMNSKSNAANPG